MHLYKFRTVNVNSLTSLASKTIWFSSQESLNDPFEGAIKVNKLTSHNEILGKALNTGVQSLMNRQGKTNEEAYEIAMDSCINNPEGAVKHYTECMDKLEAKYHELASSFGICSGSVEDSDNPDKPPQESNMLMWSHYADGLRGFCIKFDLNRLYESLQKMNKDAAFGMAPIKYDNDIFEVELHSFNDDRLLDYFGALQRKYKQWEYECEYRLLCNKLGLMQFSPNAVTHFYIGEKMPEDQKVLLNSIIKQNYPHAEIKKVFKDVSKYGLNVGAI